MIGKFYYFEMTINGITERFLRWKVYFNGELHQSEYPLSSEILKIPGAIKRIKEDLKTKTRIHIEQRYADKCKGDR